MEGVAVEKKQPMIGNGGVDAPGGAGATKSLDQRVSGLVRWIEPEGGTGHVLGEALAERKGNSRQLGPSGET